MERIPQRVQKLSARYTPTANTAQIIADKEQRRHPRWRSAFPHMKQVASNLGMSILYHTMANSLDFDLVRERVYAPWGDMYDEMKRAGIPLYALESGDSVHDFDVVAFSIGCEMAYTTVLDMLGMSGIPIRSADRPDSLPLVIAGGSSGECRAYDAVY